MIYYIYDYETGIITEKSNTPIEGDYVCTSNIDFDLEFNDIYVGAVNDSGEITFYSIRPKQVEILAQKVSELRKLIEPTINYDTCTLEELKDWQIKVSKQRLKEYLESNPIFSTCHNPNGAYYTITEEKQQYLAQMILITQLAKQNNIEYQPSWNASGEPCTYDWTLEELQQLAFEIESVVRPLVSKQQAIESQIKACETKEEVLNILISYED